MSTTQTKMDEKKQAAMAEIKADWDKQCIIAQLAADNDDQTMFSEAMTKISEIEETMRSIEKQI